jgi:hypothetical protein
VVDPYGVSPETEEVDGFTVKAPEIVPFSPYAGSYAGSAGDQITIHGHFFGTKKGRVYLGYVVNGKPTKKSCAVVSWTVVDPATGEGEIVFLLPKGLSAGVYDLIITNSVGSDTLLRGFTVNGDASAGGAGGV